MSMVVSIQDSSPVNWTSWERRFFPGGVCAEEEFCGSSWGKTFCCGGAVFSRSSCVPRACGQTAATRDSPRINCILAMRGRIMGAGHPAQIQGASLIDARGRRKRCPDRAIDSHGEEQRITRRRRGRGGFAEKKRDSLTECVGGL